MRTEFLPPLNGAIASLRNLMKAWTVPYRRGHMQDDSVSKEDGNHVGERRGGTSEKEKGK